MSVEPDINRIAAMLLAYRDSLYRIVIEQIVDNAEGRDLSAEDAADFAAAIASDYEASVTTVMQHFGWQPPPPAVSDWVRDPKPALDDQQEQE